MASSRDIEVEEYEEVVGHPDSSPVLRRSSSAESVNNVSPFQEPMMKVKEEFAHTSRPTLRYSEPELAEQTQVPRKVRVATFVLIFGWVRLNIKISHINIEPQVQIKAKAIIQFDNQHEFRIENRFRLI